MELGLFCAFVFVLLLGHATRRTWEKRVLPPPPERFVNRLFAAKSIWREER